MTIAGRIRRTSSRDIGGRRPDLLRLGGHGLTTGRRRGLLDHEREVTGQELAGGVQGTSCAYELRDVELEDVVHSLPHFELDSPAGLFDGSGKSAGIVEQDFVGADLDQQWWQIVHVAEQR